MSFDRDGACDVVGKALELISSYYPTGALEWLEKHEPAVVAQLKEAESAVDAAIMAGGPLSFPIALERFVKGSMAAFELYKNAIAKIPIQRALFPHAPNSARPEA